MFFTTIINDKHDETYNKLDLGLVDLSCKDLIYYCLLEEIDKQISKESEPKIVKDVKTNDMERPPKESDWLFVEDKHHSS
tara:strand:+ start:5522 stop:5761 length:240 start_codon:yes stop_codon:yes gene_type:complete